MCPLVFSAVLFFTDGQTPIRAKIWDTKKDLSDVIVYRKDLSDVIVYIWQTLVHNYTALANINDKIIPLVALENLFSRRLMGGILRRGTSIKHGIIIVEINF